MSGWQIIIGLIVVLVISVFIEVGVRKWLGAGKYRWKRVDYTRYHSFLNGFVSVAFVTFVIIGVLFNGFSVPSVYFLLMIFAIITFSVDAILAKKYDEDPKEYKVIIINGFVSCGLFLLFIAGMERLFL